MQVKTYLISEGVKYTETIIQDGYINKIYKVDNCRKDIYAIPDACIDIQFIYEKGRYVPYACGTHTKVSPAYISGSKKTFAVKFEPGVIPDFMKEYISDIVCDRKCLAYIDDIQNISSMLQNEDDFEKLSAVKFLVAYGNKSAIPYIINAMKNSTMAENIAGEIPYLENLFDLLKDNYEDALLTINYIINALGEILPLATIFDFELFEIFEQLISNHSDSKSAIVLLNAKEKFETLTENDEYLFDEDKNTKNEIFDIKKLLNNVRKKDLEIYINEELREDSPFVYTALDFATDTLAIRELLKSNNQTIILKTAEILKSLGNFDETARTVALLKVTDINIKAIIRAL